MIITYDNNYLAHHGIRGQKWGVRRFQNDDGSLTSAGRKRYGLGDVIRDRKILFDVKKYANKDGSLTDAGKEKFGTKEKYASYKAEQHAKRVEAGKYAVKTVAKMAITAAAVQVGRGILKGIKDIQQANADPNFTIFNTSGNSHNIFSGGPIKPDWQSNRPTSHKIRTKPHYQLYELNTVDHDLAILDSNWVNSLVNPPKPKHYNKPGAKVQNAMARIITNRRHKGR